jgi:hypothetical protein
LNAAGVKKVLTVEGLKAQMSLPADIVRLIATHLDGDTRRDKANVANLASACQAWRRYLSHHVERHRLIFPRTLLSDKELSLFKDYAWERIENLWNLRIDDIVQRFNLATETPAGIIKLYPSLYFCREDYIIMIHKQYPPCMLHHCIVYTSDGSLRNLFLYDFDSSKTATLERARAETKPVFDALKHAELHLFDK